ncbi:MAG: hypothetical protein ACLQIB_33015 [Isosphaeraceae bacterium]
MFGLSTRPQSKVIFPSDGDEARSRGNDVQHVQIDPDIQPPRGRTVWPGLENRPAKQAAAIPQIPPAEELPRQKRLLEHLRAQLATAKAILDNTPQASSTSVADTGPRQRQYVAMLERLEDLAAQPLVDLPLLVNVLQGAYNEGLIPATLQRVAQLEGQLRVAPAPTDEHKRLIANAQNSFKKWAQAYSALRAFEQTVPAVLRHELRSPRPAVGFNFGQIDTATLDRVASFAASLPEGK